MTRLPAAIAASPDVKEGESSSTSSRKSTLDACFSIQSAASRPTLTRARTPHRVTSSAWKPLTQPAVLSEELKRASMPKTNPTAKRSRVASSQAAKDPTNHSASKAIPYVPSGKKYINEECVSQGDQLDGAVILSPPKKLQRGKSSSDTISKRKATIRSQGAKLASQLPMGTSQTETGNNSASILAKVASASSSVVSQSVESVVPLLPQQLQPETAKNSNVITEAIANGKSQVNQSVAPVITEAIANRTSQINQLVAPVITKAIANRTSQVNQLVAPVITLPRKNLQTDNQKKLANVLMATSQVPAGATGPLVTPKLQIGNVKDSSSVLSNPAYRRSLLVKQQEQLLQQYKLQNSQPQPHIKGPALFSDDDVPPMEPLGTRCQLCKLDVAFRPQGDAGHAAAAPPVVAVLACHHAFHSSCIEAVYGLAEPSQCIACLDSVTAQ